MKNKYFWILESGSVKSDTMKKNFLNHIPKDWILDFEKSEYIFVFGGDGTFLRNKHLYKDKKIIPINAGNLGYFSYFCNSNLKFIFDKIINDKNFVKIEQIEIDINGKKYFAINEILIRSEVVLNLKIYLNSILLENFKGTGLMFSTPYGSTAHSKNAGGSIISPNINAIQMIEIEPLTQKKYNSLKSPLILDLSTTIKLMSTKNEKANIIIDGRIESEKLNDLCLIKSSYSDFYIFKPNDKKSYWKKLRDSFVRD